MVVYTMVLYKVEILKQWKIHEQPFMFKQTLKTTYENSNEGAPWLECPSVMSVLPLSNSKFMQMSEQ